jgi:RNA polymerase sigma factor (sigma-70 family)
MRSRHSIIEIFSTFMQFKGDYFGSWVTDSQLRRSIQHCLSQNPEEASEQFWALYWHQLWQKSAEEDRRRGDEENSQETEPNPDSMTEMNRVPPSSRSLALNHLTAYLQEVCYWVARKMRLNLGQKQPLPDLFQTAIAKVHPVVNGFNPQLSSNLKSYAEFSFGNVIKDVLRKQQEADVCTDWGLLQKVSQKRLAESLRYAGMNSASVAAYLLAWNCFKELYAPHLNSSTRKLTKPNLDTWKAIAALYNHQRLSQLSPANPALTPERLEAWILTCAKSVRSFLYPTPTSLDAPAGRQDTVDLVDRLPGSEDSLLTDMINEEDSESRQAQQTEVGSVLQAAIAKLDLQTQQLIAYYYSQTMTQQQIAEQLQMKQYTVSRRLSSAKQALLKTLAQWCKDTLHISLNSDVLNSMSTVLEEWLSAHYLPESSTPEEYL